MSLPDDYPIIAPSYVVAMAAYNGEMNRRLYGAAAELSDAERRRDRGAFLGSIHGTLSTSWKWYVPLWKRLKTNFTYWQAN